MSLEECGILNKICLLVLETPFLFKSHLSICYTYIELLSVIEVVLECKRIHIGSQWINEMPLDKVYKSKDPSRDTVVLRRGKRDTRHFIGCWVLRQFRTRIVQYVHPNP